ncbi:MAG: cellulase family glycosylhydrolase [Oscillospiraceae bacterium]|nr:cellulase family glycosylhydrolase [Oscillospiraceae bacterium]
MKKFEGYMRGINLGGWLSQCAEYSEKHYGGFIAESDIKTISEWGLDHVRLPIDHNVIENKDGMPLESGYRHIDDCVEWCEKYGLNVILDLHKTTGFAFDNKPEDNVMFDSPELQERFISLWKNIAARYGKKSNIAFELLNEIVEKDSSRWNALVSKTIAEIRRFAPDTKIIIGGIQWNSVHTLALLDVPDDKNIVYNFHFYEPFIFTHQLAPWQPLLVDKTIRYPGNMEEYRRVSKKICCFGSGLLGTDTMGAEFMEKLIAEAVEAAENADVPLYCGEYGVIDRAEISDTAVWFEDIHSVFEKFGIGRAAWTYKGIDFGISGEHYSQQLGRIIQSL